MQGFVYVMSNRSMPGIVKIGRTSRNPIDRAAELFSTGVPSPFEIRFVVFSEQSDQLEHAAHNRFRDDRLNPNREFFERELVDVVEWLTNVVVGRYDLSCIYCEKELRRESLDFACNETGCHPFEATDLMRFVDADELRRAYAKMRSEHQQHIEDSFECIE